MIFRMLSLVSLVFSVIFMHEFIFMPPCVHAMHQTFPWQTNCPSRNLGIPASAILDRLKKYDKPHQAGLLRLLSLVKCTSNTLDYPSALQRKSCLRFSDDSAGAGFMAAADLPPFLIRRNSIGSSCRGAVSSVVDEDDTH